MINPTIYKCPECGLHFYDDVTMKRCSSWCNQYKSCNLDIAKLSIELQKVKDADNS